MLIRSFSFRPCIYIYTAFACFHTFLSPCNGMVLLFLIIWPLCSFCIALFLFSNHSLESIHLVVPHLLASGVRLGSI